ncbi:lipase 1 precursor [Pochonia chlamydosporia 170]|uniref:Lipase 1 n=1 Tax=Pochonia chlamydosporia 170 TaxID=1380566 RepID=A0A179F115_METCM|nr:lipase 1 precursor [Pochonia chlamydosporia 170]OAQ59157.1 lipase 1 precursor [Pochonia chlamydosporia 170]
MSLFHVFAGPLLFAALLASALSASVPPLLPAQQGRTLSKAEVAAPIPPKQDPFYTAPPGFEAASPGQILRIRPAPGNFNSIIANCSAAYNILYRTTDSQYQPTWAVTTLFVPTSSSNTNMTLGPGPGQGLLSYQVAYDSADLNASPSFTLYSDADSAIDIGISLGQGWFVNVPDYGGPLASFTAGVISDHATLDSVRATRKASFGLRPNAPNAMWGYSGGALASEWAAELAIQYAPELRFAGAALGGLTPNVTSVLISTEGTNKAALSVAGIIGLSTQFPAFGELVEDSLKTSGKFNKTGFFASQNFTLTQAIQAFGVANVSSFFENGFNFLFSPVTQDAINRDGIMVYHGVPQMPLHVYKAIQNEISPIRDTDALVEKYCSVGVSIAYSRNAIGSHPEEFINGRAAAFAFLTNVMSGMYNSKGCQVQNISFKAMRSGFAGALITGSSVAPTMQPKETAVFTSDGLASVIVSESSLLLVATLVFLGIERLIN